MKWILKTHIDTFGVCLNLSTRKKKTALYMVHRIWVYVHVLYKWHASNGDKRFYKIKYDINLPLLSAYTMNPYGVNYINKCIHEEHIAWDKHLTCGFRSLCMRLFSWRTCNPEAEKVNESINDWHKQNKTENFTWTSICMG